MVGDDAAMANSSAEGRRPYATDLTDAQWSLVEPILPAPNLDGQHEKHPRREIVNAIFYLLRTGCAWRMLPHDLPPWQTVYRYFRRWSADGTVDRIHDRLRDRLRDDAGRDPMASAGIIDAQSARQPTPSLPDRVATTPASASTAANATWWSTPSGCCCWCRSPRRGCRTAPPPTGPLSRCGS
jgi:transposase